MNYDNNYYFIPGESICGLERVARAKGGVEGGGLALLEGGVRCRAAEGSSVGKHPGAAVFSVENNHHCFEWI